MLAVENFNSYEFFFNFLTLSLLLFPCYYFAKTEAVRRALMICAGMYMIYIIAPRLVVFYALFWLLVYFTQRFAFSQKNISRNTGISLRIAALCVMPFLVLPLLAWKTLGDRFTFNFIDYLNSATSVLSTRLWEIDTLRLLVVPLGLSFATFRAIDLLVKRYLETIPPLSLSQVMFYGFFPPVQLIGPLIEWEEVARQDTRPSYADVLDGALRVAIGFIKVFLFAAVLENSAQIFVSPRDWDTGMLWLKFIGYSWYFYLNFAGYSDMAIGTANIFGFRLKENFRFPYFQPNIQAFWASWHMSLTRWAQRNVFLPAGGYRARTQYFALFLTMMAIALWHNISLSMLVFGLYHFGAQVIYRSYAAHAVKMPSTPFSRCAGSALTYLVVLISLPLLYHDPEKILDFYLALAGQ